MRKQSNKQLYTVQDLSRQTTQKKRYHAYELEALAVVASLKHFRNYLTEVKFTVVTDCNVLRTTMNKRDLLPRIGRCWLWIQEYNFMVQYKLGTKMTHVDAVVQFRTRTCMS